MLEEENSEQLKQLELKISSLEDTLKEMDADSIKASRKFKRVTQFMMAR